MVFRFPGSVSLSLEWSDLGINPFSSADHEIGGENQRGEGTDVWREGCIPLVVAVFRKENSFQGGGERHAMILHIRVAVGKV